MSSRTRRSKRSGGFVSHGHLIAAETLLLVGAFKDWLFGAVARSHLANWSKVALVMAATVGLLGGVFVLVERLTARGVSGAHSSLRARSGLPTLVIHLAILFLLFLLYARMLKLDVFA